MKLEDFLQSPWHPNTEDGDEYTVPVMEMFINGNLVRRWEDGTAFLFRPGAAEGERLAWGVNDPGNPLGRLKRQGRRQSFC